MGAGKTTVGMELAKKLNYKLIDTDHSIENDQSREIKDIFSEDGELFFRNLEKKNIFSNRKEQLIYSFQKNVINHYKAKEYIKI